MWNSPCHARFDELSLHEESNQNKCYLCKSGNVFNWKSRSSFQKEFFIES